MNNNRKVYIDNLKLFVIILVVIQHLAVTYSGMGDWYYMEHGEVGIVSTIIFTFHQAFTQSYFMGLMFLLSGYFVPTSYDKKGFSKFVIDRMIRLGIPTIIYMIIIHPITNYVIMGHRKEGADLLSSYTDYILNLEFIGESDPLWFTLALLVFSIVYALFRKCLPIKSTHKRIGIPSFLVAIMLISFISICAFLVRIVQPIGTNVFNMQLCFFSQYIVLFILGIISRRNDWFEKLSYVVGTRWLISGLSLGFIVFIIVLVSGGALDGNYDVFYGGIHWQSAAYAIWDSFVAVSMNIGLITLFKEKFNKQNKLIQNMSDNAFSVYIFHAPIIVALTYLIKDAILLPIVKFIILTVIAIPLCFLMVNFTIRKIPILRKLFS